MIGQLIGAGIGAVGSIFGGMSASKAMRELRNRVSTQKANNKAWYDRAHNEDATQRADAMALLERTKESIRQRNQRAAGVQAVIGGTEDNLEATKDANNRAIGDATAQIAAAAERRKDIIEGQYQARDAALDGQLNALDEAKARNITEAIKGSAAAGSSIASLF